MSAFSSDTMRKKLESLEWGKNRKTVQVGTAFDASAVDEAEVQEGPCRKDLFVKYCSLVDMSGNVFCASILLLLFF